MIAWTQANAERIYDLPPAAEAAGLTRGMALAEARAFCPGLVSRPADPAADARLLAALLRWAGRYCPWVGRDGADGLALDVTGSTRLAGGEAALLADMQARLTRAGLAVRLGLADTRGAAWALAHFRPGIAPPGQGAQAIADLPVAALRIGPDASVALQRMGLRRIGDLADQPRAPLARRFGPGLLTALDRATGALAEQISPEAAPPVFAARLTLPEPIGLLSDVTAGTRRLLDQLCARLATQALGARALRLELRRVDHGQASVTLRLARAMRDPARILPLFERDLAAVDAGFGIDQMRIEATLTEPLPPEQTAAALRGPGPSRAADAVDDLTTRIAARIGAANLRRFRPLDSHIPERAFACPPALDAPPAPARWPLGEDRPLRLFPPEPIAAEGAAPPARFRWRAMRLTTGRAAGPERIAPEWWAEDDGWRAGLRDYWRVETREGRRLWMFRTPQSPGWFVQGEFA